MRGDVVNISLRCQHENAVVGNSIGVRMSLKHSSSPARNMTLYVCGRWEPQDTVFLVCDMIRGGSLTEFFDQVIWGRGLEFVWLLTILVIACMALEDQGRNCE